MTNTLNFTGWKKWCPTAEEYEAFEVEGKLPFELLENEYLIICEDAELTKPINQYCYENGELRRVSYGSIVVPKSKMPQLEEPTKDDILKSKNDAKSLKKVASKKSSKKDIIYPRNIEQVCAIDLLKDTNKTIKLITGSWGTGKTMLLVSSAINLLKNGYYDKIIWIRNNIDVKDTKDMGALPGEAIEKLLPYLGPFIDHVGEDEVKCMINNGNLVVEPLQFLRGRNFERAIIMCSEAENLTKEHIQLIIARAASESILMFDADTRQRDKAIFDTSKGIERMIESLAGEPLFGYVHLTKSERSETAALADKIK